MKMTDIHFYVPEFMSKLRGAHLEQAYHVPIEMRPSRVSRKNLKEPDWQEVIFIIVTSCSVSCTLHIVQTFTWFWLWNGCDLKFGYKGNSSKSSKSHFDVLRYGPCETASPIGKFSKKNH